MTTISRRSLLKTAIHCSLGAAALQGTGLGAAQRRSTTPSPSSLADMKVGSQFGGTSEKNLEFHARHGVFHIDGGSPKFIDGVGWDLEDSLRKREACEQYGIKLEAYHLPLTSSGIERVRFPHIMLGKSPERDREIEMIQQMIEVAAKTDVRLLLYNTTIHSVLRTGLTTDPKRGNARYSTWNYEEARKNNQANTIAGVVSIDEVYERITYLLDRLLPVAEANNVKLGNHIADPPAPAGYRGITRWNSPHVFNGIMRFASLYDSPSHGFNLCLGSIAEGVRDPRSEIVPIIRWVGKRKQIFNIHFRNIIGGWNDFQEVYLDNGDMDMVAVMEALAEVGYSGMIMPDHVPGHTDPESGRQGHAFSFGYIKALIQATLR